MLARAGKVGHFEVSCETKKKKKKGHQIMLLASFVEVPVESPNMEGWQEIHGEV